MGPDLSGNSYTLTVNNVDISPVMATPENFMAVSDRGEEAVIKDVFYDLKDKTLTLSLSPAVYTEEAYTVTGLGINEVCTLNEMKSENYNEISILKTEISDTTATVYIQNSTYIGKDVIICAKDGDILLSSTEVYVDAETISSIDITGITSNTKLTLE